jgi:hypothetical protein
MNTPETQPGGSLEPVGSVRDVWRTTVGDDVWDSEMPLDALIDAEQAIQQGHTKVVIERIAIPPNDQAHARREEPRT